MKLNSKWGSSFMLGAILLSMSACSDPSTSSSPPEVTPETPMVTLYASPLLTPVDPSEVLPPATPSPDFSGRVQPSPQAEIPSDVPRNPSPTRTVAPPQGQNPAPPPQTKASLSVNIFYPDSNCETLVPQPVTVDAQKSLDGAIAQVLAKGKSADFAIAGYQINVNPQGIATVDFRLPDNSPRTFHSLSTCEQFALFGSIRQTLLTNPQWHVKDVRFTEQGAELYL